MYNGEWKGAGQQVAAPRISGFNNTFSRSLDQMERLVAEDNKSKALKEERDYRDKFERGRQNFKLKINANDRAFKIGEHEKNRTFQSGERIAKEDANILSSIINRTHQTSERIGGENARSKYQAQGYANSKSLQGLSRANSFALAKYKDQLDNTGTVSGSSSFNPMDTKVIIEKERQIDTNKFKNKKDELEFNAFTKKVNEVNKTYNEILSEQNDYNENSTFFGGATLKSTKQNIQRQANKYASDNKINGDMVAGFDKFNNKNDPEKIIATKKSKYKKVQITEKYKEEDEKRTIAKILKNKGIVASSNSYDSSQRKAISTELENQYKRYTEDEKRSFDRTLEKTKIRDKANISNMQIEYNDNIRDGKTHKEAVEIAARDYGDSNSKILIRKR
jgi:hypothetical protein